MTDILAIGSSGLTAYRKLLETTGNNIANANTEGYVRRDVVLKSVGEAQMLPTARISSSGSGVTVDLIRRASDAFLQMQVRAASANQAQLQVISDGLVRIEKAIIAPSNTIGVAVQEFYAKAQDLSVTPASTSTRLALIDAGQRVAESFRHASKYVSSEIKSSDLSLSSSLDAVNSLAGQIARLNLDIGRTGKGQQKLNDLLDQRDVLLNNLAKLVNFTIVEKDTGSIDVYLGDAASGPKLVDVDTARMLGITKTGNKVDLIFDPYGNASITNQVTGGVVAGLIEFQKAALHFLENIDQLAVGFTDAVNKQHRQGVDLNGLPGATMFLSEGLEAIPASSNRGSAKVTVAIESATSINGDSYTAIYSAESKNWSIKSKASGASINGNLPLTLEGLHLSVEGNPAEGDTFIVEPLKNASAALNFLIDDPAGIAAAQNIYVDPALTNIGKGSLTVLRTDYTVSPPQLPSMLDLFKANGTDSLSFRKDGVAFSIPAGAKNTTITTFKTPSSVTFEVSAQDLRAMSNNGVLEIKFTIDDQEISYFIQPDIISLGSVAEAINQLVISETEEDNIRPFVASEANGKIIIATNDNHTLSKATIFGKANDNGQIIKVDASVQSPKDASDIVIFTREGIQIAGPKITNGQDIDKWINASNGFLATANYQYRPDSNGTYRNLPLLSHDACLKPIEIDGVNSHQNFTFEVQGNPNLNGTFLSGQGLSPVSALYGLDVKGLPAIRLDGTETAGLEASDVADRLIDKLDQMSTTQYWLGKTIQLATSNEVKFEFNLSLNGEITPITFRRSKDESGNWLPGGVFEGTPNGIQLSLLNQQENGVWKQRISISSSRIMGQEANTLRIEPNPASQQLGLVDGDNMAFTSHLKAGGKLDPIALSNGLDIQIKVDGVTTPLTVQGSNGRQDFMLGGKPVYIEWSVVDGELKFTSSANRLQVIAETSVSRDAAIKLGFLGSDLHISKQVGIFADHVVSARALNGTKLSLKISGEDRLINIIGEKGFTEVDQEGNAIARVSWEMIDNRLVLSCSSSTFQLTADTEEQVQAASLLGFSTTNAAFLEPSTRIRIISDVTDDVSLLANVDASSSLLGEELTIGYAPEDLIVGVFSNDIGANRNLTVRYPVDTVRKQPDIPNFGVVVDSPTQLRIVKFDTTDPSQIVETYAVRQWAPREPIQWLGLEFVIDGAVAASDITYGGDRFLISRGDQRSGDNRNTLALAKLQTADLFGKNQGSFQDVYASIATKLGTSSQSAASDAKTAEQAASNLQAAFDAKTGVNLDQEASDLIRYQQAYQAAAQVVKSARDLFDAILRIM
jgi:flagellar hook-associated protein 1 FlgK